ncbi:MAG TPA: hypothetical protein PKD73_08280 [Burkholderiaceae bacterium]|nr:hypothetical protein [Burkholderiaceae bacterium]
MTSSTLKLGALAGALVALAGCTTPPSVPVVEAFPPMAQKKLRSAAHWQAIAREAADRTLAMLDQGGVTPATTIYVGQSANATAFDQALREFIVTELVQRGRRVMPTPDKAVLAVSHQTQVVTHRTPRFDHTTQQYAMGPDAKAFWIPAPQAPAYAWTTAYWPARTEVIVNTTIGGADRTLVRKSDVYYVDQADAGLFANGYGQLPARSMKVVAQ